MLNFLVAPLFARSFCPTIEEMAALAIGASQCIIKLSSQASGSNSSSTFDMVLAMLRLTLVWLRNAIAQHPVPKKVCCTHRLAQASCAMCRTDSLYTDT
jgi:hypothetical protein